MCINPATLVTGETVGCRKCWQCKSNKIQDWVGRCIAEGETAVACHYVTLTYGRDEHGNVDHARAAILTYSDVQKFFKKLRAAGYPVRYFVVGEFGGVKGRTHWHALLYWLQKPPNHITADKREVALPIGKRFDWSFWTHGHAYCEEVTASSVRYCCKYIQKDFRDQERQGRFNMSRMPPLGAVYFGGLARRYVQQGLAPQAPVYHFRSVNDDKGRTVKFYLHRRSLELFLEAYVFHWREMRGGNPPHSDLVAEYLDAQAGYVQEPAPKAFKPSYGKPWIDPPKGGEVVFSEPYNTWVWLGKVNTLFWSFDDEGKRAWHAEIRTETIADRMRAVSEIRAASSKHMRR